MVIVSNGFGKFPLAVAAVELQKRGLLAGLVTGGYPTRAWRALARRTPVRHPKVERFLGRAEELPDTLVHPMWLAEAVHELALAQIRRDLARSRSWSAFACDLYGRRAARVVHRLSARASVYHYRSGFGGASAAIAKETGMLTLCDHSIAHPEVIEELVENGGAIPARRVHAVLDPLWECFLRDIERADHVVVNSDFVRRTFVQQGYPPGRVHVVRMGVDDDFLAAAEAVGDRRAPGGPLRLLFVGALERRKGVDHLLKALGDADLGIDWRLDLIGPIRGDLADPYRRLLDDPRVRTHGVVGRLELATHMGQADAFVFPSLAEGSARVIPMAMACGCFVITTPNSGSIVEHGRHGLLVPPGDADALRAAIVEAASDQERLHAIGRENRRVVGSSLRQEHYGDALVDLYARLQDGAAAAARPEAVPA